MNPPRSLRLGLFGVSGKLGRRIASLALADPRFTLVAPLTYTHSPHLGIDLGSLLGRAPLGLPLTAELQEEVDLLIDVSLPQGFVSRLALALQHHLPLVLGTTNLSPTDLQQLHAASAQIPLFYAVNFSLGMALMQQLSQIIAKHFPTAHMDLIETHHHTKKDAPSGSALRLSQAIQNALPESPPIPIHSLRSGQIIGEHTLLFNTAEERLTLSHTVHSRDAFARGALESALFLIQQSNGVYSMDDL